MIAPLLFAAALDYTAEGGQPPSALPPEEQGGIILRIPGGMNLRIHTKNLNPRSPSI